MTARGDGIRCPLCDNDTYVIETRANKGSLRRRRGCLSDECFGRLTTVEMPAPRYSKGTKAATLELAPVPAADAQDIVTVPRAVVRKLVELLQDLNMEPLAPLTSLPVRKRRRATPEAS